MRKFQIGSLMGIIFVAGIGIGVLGKTYLAKPEKIEPEKTLEEKIFSWISSGKTPGPEIKPQQVTIPVSIFPADYKNRYFPEDENATTIADEIDVDDDGQPELLVFSSHGNRNVSYDMFKKINGKWKLCGSVNGVYHFFAKHNGKTGVFSKWGLGYAGASYSFSQFIDGEWKEIIDFNVDGRAESSDGKKDEIVIKLQTENNFMKKGMR